MITLLTDATIPTTITADVVKKPMTIHAAKGLEFLPVLTAGMGAGSFPQRPVHQLPRGAGRGKTFVLSGRATAPSHAFSFTYLPTAVTVFGPSRSNGALAASISCPSSSCTAAAMRASAFATAATFSRASSCRSTMPEKRERLLLRRALSGKNSPRPASRYCQQSHASPGFTVTTRRNWSLGMDVEHQKFGFAKIISMEGAPNNPHCRLLFLKGGGEKEDHAQLCQADNAGNNK